MTKFEDQFTAAERVIDTRPLWYWLVMRLLHTTLTALACLSLSACGSAPADGGGETGGAAHLGIVAEIDTMPDVTIDDEFGTDVRVSLHLAHMGGPAADTLEVVSASLGLDLEPYADIELAIPDDHPPFAGLADGESVDLSLRGSIPDNHDDWGLCAGGGTEEADGPRVSLDLALRVAPGANDEEDEFIFESMAVAFHCSFTG